MLTEVHLQQIMKHASRARLSEFLKPLQSAVGEFEIGKNLHRVAAFIAQLAHESGEFRYMEEIWGPTPAQRRYEPVTDLSKRLGNKEKGDGFRFKGRGPIQITGRSNYERYGGLLEIDLVAKSETAATPEVGFRIAGLYWNRNGLNERADARDFEGITKRINGGLNGQADRLKYYELALQVLAGAFPSSAVARRTRGRQPKVVPLERGAEALRLDAGMERPVSAKRRGKGNGKDDKAAAVPRR